jgi:hypothetical protein
MQKLKNNFMNVKSITMKDILRKILKEIIYVSLRKNKSSVSTFLRIILLATHDISHRLIRMSYSPIYLS